MPIFFSVLQLFVLFLPFSSPLSPLHTPGTFNLLRGDPTQPPYPARGAPTLDYQSVSIVHGEYDAANTPGFRDVPAFTQLSPSSFIIYGGAGFHASGSSPFLCDLWEFNTEFNMWRFLSGCYDDGGYDLGTKSYSFGVGVSPSGKQQSNMFPNILYDSHDTLSDAWGRVFLFGGYFFSSDLWELDVGTRLWRCSRDGAQLNTVEPGFENVFHQGNIPGARVSNAFWWYGDWYWSGSGKTNVSGWGDSEYDRKLVVFFGGSGYEGQLNDVWELNLETLEYRLARGDPTLTNSMGDYGPFNVSRVSVTGEVLEIELSLKGQFSDLVDPPSRYGAMWWATGPDALYVFAGRQPKNNLFFADMWIYSRSRAQWKFVGGTPAILSIPGISELNYTYSYDSWHENVWTPNGTFNSSNLPTQRRHAFFWKMGTSIVVYGGDKFDDREIYLFGDVWEFDTISAEWACLQFCGTWNASRDRRYDIAFPHIPSGRTAGVTFKTLLGEPALYGGTYGSNDLWSLNGLVDFCRNHSVLENQWVCNSHGDCENDVCNCTGSESSGSGGDEGLYWGDDCENWNCYGKPKGDDEVCSGHGVCAAADTCVCEVFVGVMCENFTCFLEIPGNEGSCGGHGTCVGLDSCVCEKEDNWYGIGCQEEIIDAVLYNQRTSLRIRFFVPYMLLNTTERDPGGFPCTWRFKDVTEFGEGALCSWERDYAYGDYTTQLDVILGQKPKLKNKHSVTVRVVTIPSEYVTLIVSEEKSPADILAIVFSVFCGVGATCLIFALLVCFVFLILLIRNIHVSRNIRQQMLMMNLLERPACP